VQATVDEAEAVSEADESRRGRIDSFRIRWEDVSRKHFALKLIRKKADQKGAA
jgi:hypothetical protein